MDSKTEPASEAKERIEREAIDASYNIDDSSERQAFYVGYIAGATAEQEEITRLKAELERERELRKGLVNACEGVIRLRYLLEFNEDVVGAAYEGEAVAINRMIFVIEKALEKAKN